MIMIMIRLQFNHKIKYQSYTSYADMPVVIEDGQNRKPKRRLSRLECSYLVTRQKVVQTLHGFIQLLLAQIGYTLH